MGNAAIHSSYPGDGCHFLVYPDFSWDLCWPNGSHQRGGSSSLDEALAAMNAARNAFILECWGRGKLAGQNFVCPLS